MTLQAFQSRAVKAFKRANPGATVTQWTFGPKRVTYPTGFKGLYGRFTVTNGEVAGEMRAEYDDTYGLAVERYGPSRRLTVTP